MGGIRALKEQLDEQLREAACSLLGHSQEAAAGLLPLQWSLPSDPSFGDLSTPAAFSLARIVRRNPRDVAEELAGRLRPAAEAVQRLEVAGRGYINLHLRGRWWQERLPEIIGQGEAYGRSDLGQGRKTLVEFVSANPTGPLHVGHGRGAAVGDALSNLLSAAGFEVEREYYINDAGTQMEILGRSVWARYRELIGEEAPFPENGYRGEYIRDLARELAQTKERELAHLPAHEAISCCRDFAASRILERIREDLMRFGVRFDQWFSESSLHQRGAIQRALVELQERGLAYRREGAIWFASSRFGDDKDRVLVRENGDPTYFASDVAYHADKFRRGFSLLIDIWGADHHGYIHRMKAVVQALGHPPDSLQILLIQLVSLLRGGRPVAMSTRAGEFVPLQEVIAEVGADAARFLFLTRRSDSHLEFDLEVAKAQSLENPVYYVQYAHARLCSVLREAEKAGFHLLHQAPEVRLLDREEELSLIKSLVLYPEVIRSSALSFEPHRITVYLQDLASRIHSYYNKFRFLSDDRPLSEARLCLARSILIVLRNALSLLGVSAPERM